MEVLEITDRWIVATGDACHRFDEPFDVFGTRAQTSARPDRSRHPAPVPAKHVLAIGGYVFTGQAESRVR